MLIDYANQERMLDFKTIYAILNRISSSPTSALRELTRQRPYFDLVVEAAIEDKAVKQDVLSRLGDLAQANPDILIGTTSLTFEVDEVAGRMDGQTKYVKITQFIFVLTHSLCSVIGLRFLWPVMFIPCVVVRSGSFTSSKTAERLNNTMQRLHLRMHNGDSHGWGMDRKLSKTEIENYRKGR